MGKLRKLVPLLMIALVVGLMGCSDKSKSGDDDDSTTPPPDDGTPTPGQPGAPAVPPAVSGTSPLGLQMSTKFDDTNYSYVLTFVETGTDTCMATPTNPVVTCTVEVPEGRLFYSSLKFAYSYLPSSCRLMTFQPYYYRASLQAHYLPPYLAAGGPGVDCRVGAGLEPVGPDCFGGAAPNLVPGFPAFRYLIYLPDESDLTTPVTAIKTLDSAYSKAYGSNRHSVNDMSLANQAIDQSAADLGDIGDTYIADSYVDYQFTCRDDWADPASYTINLKVKDVDTAGTGPNNMLTWKELP